METETETETNDIIVNREIEKNIRKNPPIGNSESDIVKDHKSDKFSELPIYVPRAGFRGGSQSSFARKIILFQLTANFIDLLCFIGVGLMFIAVSNYMQLIQFEKQFIFSKNFVIATGIIYFHLQIVIRLMFGQSIGEWACRLKLLSFGNKRVLNIGNMKIPLSSLIDRTFRIFMRSYINMVTGFFFFPVLSLIYNQDYLGYLTKVYYVRYE